MSDSNARFVVHRHGTTVSDRSRRPNGPTGCRIGRAARCGGDARRDIVAGSGKIAKGGGSDSRAVAARRQPNRCCSAARTRQSGRGEHASALVSYLLEMTLHRPPRRQSRHGPYITNAARPTMAPISQTNGTIHRIMPCACVDCRGAVHPRSLKSSFRVCDTAAPAPVSICLQRLYVFSAAASNHAHEHCSR